MKLSGVKSIVGKVMAIGLVAGAVALASPAKAQAQQYGIGPSYHDADRWDGYGRSRYEREREAIARHEAWERHQRWEHAREYDHDRGRGYDRDRAPYGYAAPDGYGYGNNDQRGYFGR